MIPFHFRATLAAALLLSGAVVGCSGSDAPAGESQAALTSAAHVVESPPADATSADSFYVTFFAYQTGGNGLINKENSHTFAQYVHARPDGSGGVSVNDEDLLHISWMPDSGVVRAFGAMEPGANTEVDFEMNRGAGVKRARGFAWGPFRIPEVIFRRAERQTALLATGSVLYRASERDSISKNTDYLESDDTQKPQFLNCLAAVGDVAPNGGTIVGAASGRAGTQEIVDHYAPFFIDGTRGNDGFHDRHRWLSTRLNLSRFNPLFQSGLELQEQQGRNAAGADGQPVDPQPTSTFSSCFCQGSRGLFGKIECSFFGVRPGETGQISPQKSLRPAPVNSAGECATSCSDLFPEFSTACGGTINNTGNP